MGDYIPVQMKRHAQVPLRQTAEARFWSSYKLSGVLQIANSAATHVDFNPVRPEEFAVTAGARIVIWNGLTVEPQRTIGRFKDIAYSGSFRHDGKLLVAGGENGVIQVFNLESRGILRTFRGHTAPVHTTRFSNDGLRVLSGSDDCTLRMWDVPTEKCIQTIYKHGDFVRTQCPSPNSSHLWAAGCFDHSVRLFDIRISSSTSQSSSRKPILTMDHGFPVSSVLLLEGGALAVSAGGDELRVWDLFSGGKLISRLKNHSKAVTCVCVDSKNEHLISGGLDGLVNIYDIGTFQPQHSLRFEGQILSICASRDGTRIGASMSNGSAAIRMRSKHRQEDNDLLLQSIAGIRRTENEFEGMSLGRPKLTPETAATPRLGSKRYFMRGMGEQPGPNDVVINKQVKPKQHEWDVDLRNFEYSKALDSALATKRTNVQYSVLEELEYRQGLVVALQGRDEERLIPIVEFLLHSICDVRYSELLIHVANLVLDLYFPRTSADVMGVALPHVSASLSPRLHQRFLKLLEAVRGELDLQRLLMQCMGSVDLILSARLGEVQPKDDGI